MPGARDELIAHITEKAVFHGDFTLTSGKQASFYVDLRRVSLDHRVAPLIGQVMLDLIAGVPGVSAVGGLTMGADPIATAILHQGAARGVPLDAFVVRKEPKDHGRGRQVEGPDVAGRRVIVVEDTSTTGGLAPEGDRRAREGRRRDRRRRRRGRPGDRRARGHRGRRLPLPRRARPRRPRSRGVNGPLDATGSAPLAVVERSGFPESVHVGAAVVLEPDGAERRRIGDPDRLIYARSALKPFQTVAALRAGARFTPEQLVIVTSSHGGTPRHVEVVREVLEASGLGEEALRTPESWPSATEAARERVRAGLGPARITMNCSGNHAGMLAGSVAAGWPTDGYLDPAHPIHALAATVLAEYGGATPTHQGVDGCGGPVWAVPLIALAEGYRCLVADQPRLAAAIRAHPDLIEGPGTPTSRAIAALGVVAKSGAEGVFAAVAPDGTTAAVKVLDGAGRAPAAVAVALLAEAGAVDPAAADAYLDDRSSAVLGGGEPVGRIRVLV